MVGFIVGVLVGAVLDIFLTCLVSLHRGAESYAIDLKDIRVADCIDTLFSHNEIVELHEEDAAGYLRIWRGVAYQIPAEYLDLRLVRFFGPLPMSLDGCVGVKLIVHR